MTNTSLPSTMDKQKGLANERNECVRVEVRCGGFTVRILYTSEDLKRALMLRFNAFQVEMMGLPTQGDAIDLDEFDEVANHLGVFDNASGEIVATCRLICSNYTRKFYSEQEFNCEELLGGPRIKLEVGRVCVSKNFRSGIVMGVLWKGIAKFITATNSEILFGCGSIATIDPNAAAILYRYFRETERLHRTGMIEAKAKYRSNEFEMLVKDRLELTAAERDSAAKLVPPLCRAYFEMGCRVAGGPAFDYEFKCIDFLTFLDLNNLSSRVRKRMFGVSSI